MTDLTENPETEGQESLLPTAPVDISQLRVTRAELARFLGCTKQTTGEWARKGVVTFAAYDQRVGLKDAIEQVLVRGNLKFLRVRVLRDLARDLDAYRERISELEKRVTKAEAEAKEFEAASTLAAKQSAEIQANAEQAAEFRYRDKVERELYALQRDVIEHFSVLVAAQRRGDLEVAFERMVDRIFYPEFDPDEADDEEPPAEAMHKDEMAGIHAATDGQTYHEGKTND